MRASSLLLVVLVLLGVLFLAQTTADAQTTYITLYGQLDYYQCTTTGSPLAPCENYFYLATNGTTPGIPTYPVLDFSQSIVPEPAQSDVGKIVSVMGYYGQESSCGAVNSCPAFFVHIWGPYYEATFPTTTIACFTSSNPTTTGYSGQCGTAPPVPLGGSTISTGGPNLLGELMSLSSAQLAIIAIVMVVVAYLLIHRKK